MIRTLIPVSLIYGFAAALALRRFSDREAVRASINRMIAHLYEFRLFIDTPSLIFRAQMDLLRENLRLLRLILLPCAMLAVFFVALFPQLDAWYGHTPLPPGEPSVITAQFDDAVLEAPAGIAVETPPVHSVHDHEVSWRVRPLGKVSGELRLRHDGHLIVKQIVVGSGWIDGYTGRGVGIHYPRRTVFEANWMVWFFLLSGIAALVYR